MGKVNLMNLTMSQIMIFTTTAKFENFTSAAKYLNIAQPMVSRNIAQLESTLGFSLFTREKQHVSLTPAGRALASSMVSVTENLEFSIQNARSVQNEGQEALFICNDRGVDKNYYIYPLLDRISSVCPNAHINVECTDASWAIDCLYKGSADVSFVMLHETHLLNPNILEWKILHKMPWCAYVPKSNHLFDRDSISMKDINNEPIIMLSPLCSQSYCDSVYKMFEDFSIFPKIIASVSNSSSLSFAMHQGNGIVLANELLAVPDHNDTKLFPLSGTNDALCIAWKKNTSNPVVSTFLRVAEYFFNNEYSLNY